MDNSTREIFRSIEYYNEHFPEEEIIELLNREEESRNFLIEYIKEFKKNIFKHLNEDDYVGHIYSVMILAQFKEEKLCSLFLDLLRLPGTRVYELFDTVIPEYGARIIASVYDGNIDNIVEILNDKKVNEYAKAITIQALKILCINNRLTESEVENFLIDLLSGRLKNKNQTVLLEILYTAFELKMDRVLELLKKGCKSGEYKRVLSVEEIEAEIKLYEEGMYLNTGINDVHNQEIVSALDGLKDIFQMIEEKNTMKKQVQKLQDTIIEEINELSKKFKKGICSTDFESHLKSLSKDELYEIGRNLSLKGYYKLKKDELRKLICDNYEEAIREKLNTFDEVRVKELMLFIKSGGIRKVERSKQLNTFFYLESYGLIFPFADKKNTFFIMPDITRDIVKEVTSAFIFRKKIKINSEIVILLKGMMEVYGIMSVDELINKLRMYGISESDSYLKKVINEGDGINYSILNKKYVVNGNIDNYNIVEEVRKSKFKYDYKLFSKDEIQAMGNGEWIDCVDYAEEFYERFSEEFIIEKEAITDLINEMKVDVQVMDIEVITQFMVDSIDDKCNDMAEVQELKEAKRMVKKLVEQFLENIPLWKYRGRSIKEIRVKENKG